MVRILLDLGIWDQAKQVLHQLAEGGGEDTEIILLNAETDFRRGDYAGAGVWFSRVSGSEHLLDTEELDRYRFWMGV